MKLRKILAAVLALVLVVTAFAACGKKENADSSKLTSTIKLNSELYGVGFRKNSNLVAELNKYFASALADGTLKTVAEKYKVQEALITDESNYNVAASDDANVDDLTYVKGKGVLVVGITDFEPMDYKDEQGNWIGFDADLATKFAEILGVKVEFVEIDWDNKVLELNSKKIDCVWNGMTLTDEVKSSMSTSAAYCNNAQVVVVKQSLADKANSVEACKSLNFAVESGSAGKDMAVENGFNYTEVKDQATAIMEVSAGTCDAAIIDSLMAAAMVDNK